MVPGAGDEGTSYSEDDLRPENLRTYFPLPCPPPPPLPTWLCPLLLGGGPASYGPGGTGLGFGVACPGAVALLPREAVPECAGWDGFGFWWPCRAAMLASPWYLRRPCAFFPRCFGVAAAARPFALAEPVRSLDATTCETDAFAGVAGTVCAALGRA